jgi:DNA invertase Pin-like site-specific DNA recombinase
MKPCFFYARTSSASGADDSDSLPRQRDACVAYAKTNGYEIVEEFWDRGVSGTVPLRERPAFQALLAKLNGTRTILLDCADRLSRDAVVAITGHKMLRDLGIELIAVASPQHFVDDSPTSKVIRGVLAVIAEFEKDMIVLRLQRGRQKALAERGWAGGHQPIADEVVKHAKRLHRPNRRTGARRSLREIAKELSALGFNAPSGQPYHAGSIRHMLDK